MIDIDKLIAVRIQFHRTRELSSITIHHSSLTLHSHSSPPLIKKWKGNNNSGVVDGVENGYTRG